MGGGPMTQILEEANLRMSTTEDRDDSLKDDDDQSIISIPIITPGIFGVGQELKVPTSNSINLFQGGAQKQ